MKAYWALFKQQMIAQTQYRTGFWARLSTNIFFGFGRAAVLVAFYHFGTGQAALSLQQAVAMTWLGQMFICLLPGVNMDFAVWEKIRSGDVGYELARPLDVYAHWYVNAIAVKLGPVLLAVLPVGLAALLAPGELGLMPPASPAHLAACLATLLTGLSTSCAMILISYAMLMDTRVGQAPSTIAIYLAQILSGLYLPLQLWPDWMQGFLYYQPFAGMMDLPFRFYVGAVRPSQAFFVTGLQLSWTLVFVGVGRWWIRRNFKKLVIQGG